MQYLPRPGKGHLHAAAVFVADTMDGSPNPGPGRAYYLLPLIFVLAGAAIFGVVLWQGLFHLTGLLVQVVAPGEAELSLVHGQTYTVFLEQQSVVNGRIYATGEVNGLKCTLNTARGEIVPLRQPGMTTSYRMAGRSGRSALEFEVPEDGTYKFACRYENASGPETVLAVGSGVGARIARTVLTSLAAIFGGVIAGAVAFLGIFFLRRKAGEHAALPGQAAV